jgi:hypothetical protein
MKFKLPRNIISNNVIKNVLYLITLVLAVSYIINEQNLALITLILIACGVYVMNKSVVISLFIAIIITNLLLSTNYFKNINITEGLQNNDNCCSGETFYESNLINYSNISENINNKITCANIENDINAKMPTDESQKARFLAILYSNYGYLKAKSICDTMDASSAIVNMKGMLFKKSNITSNVLDDPNILPKDILNLIETSNIKNLLDENTNHILEINVISPLETINTYLINNSQQKNLQTPITISDLTTVQKIQLTSIKDTLKKMYSSSDPNLVTKKSTTYTVVDNKNNSTNAHEPITNNNTKEQYILNSDQFFDCMGGVNDANSGTFSQSDISNSKVILGTIDEGTYNPYGTVAQLDLYPSNKDLEMELRRLETIPSSGNVPVNVITTYLNAINNFYEKQIQNLTASKSSTFNQETINDIYSIKTIKPTFFTYDNTFNNEYQCQDSITGNSAFKYCGPSAYYDVPKF